MQVDTRGFHGEKWESWEVNRPRFNSNSERPKLPTMPNASYQRNLSIIRYFDKHSQKPQRCYASFVERQISHMQARHMTMMANGNTATGRAEQERIHLIQDLGR